MPNPRFHPRLIDALRGYNRQTFSKDLLAGITVGIIALPFVIRRVRSPRPVGPVDPQLTDI